MQGDYPCFKTTYTHEELVEHFLLSPAERAVVETCREDANRHGVAVLLKAVQYLGYFPYEFQHVPEVVRTFIAHQLQLLWDHTPEYPWKSRSHDNHVALIRQQTGWHFPTGRTRRPWKRGSGHRGLGRRRRKRSCANVPTAVCVPWALNSPQHLSSSDWSAPPSVAFFRISTNASPHSSPRKSRRRLTSC